MAAVSGQSIAVMRVYVHMPYLGSIWIMQEVKAFDRDLVNRDIFVLTVHTLLYFIWGSFQDTRFSFGQVPLLNTVLQHCYTFLLDNTCGKFTLQQNKTSSAKFIKNCRLNNITKSKKEALCVCKFSMMYSHFIQKDHKFKKCWNPCVEKCSQSG